MGARLLGTGGAREAGGVEVGAPARTEPWLPSVFPELLDSPPSLWVVGNWFQDVEVCHCLGRADTTFTHLLPLPLPSDPATRVFACPPTNLRAVLPLRLWGGICRCYPPRVQSLLFLTTAPHCDVQNYLCQLFTDSAGTVIQGDVSWQRRGCVHQLGHSHAPSLH